MRNKSRKHRKLSPKLITPHLLRLSSRNKSSRSLPKSIKVNNIHLFQAEGAKPQRHNLKKTLQYKVKVQIKKVKPEMNLQLINKHLKKNIKDLINLISWKKSQTTKGI